MAKGNLSACLPITLACEGGTSTLRSDPGNWTGGRIGAGRLKGTRFGIAAASHPRLDIARLTMAEAQAIYAREYWEPAGCDALPAGLDLSHFDATVNSGHAHSARWLAAATGGTVEARIHAYARARLMSLEGWRIWATFGKGLAARVGRVEAASLSMALGGAAPAAIGAKAEALAGKARLATARTMAGAAASGAGATAVVATSHPAVAAGVTLVALATVLAGAFSAWSHGGRAAALARAATP